MESDTFFVGHDFSNEPLSDFLFHHFPPVKDGYFIPEDTINFRILNDTTYIDYIDTLPIDRLVLEDYTTPDIDDVDSLKKQGYENIVFYTHWEEWLEWQ